MKKKREILIRIISGVILGATTVAAIACGHTGYALMPFIYIALFAFAALVEFYHISKRGETERPFSATGYLFAIFTLFAFYGELLYKSRVLSGVELPAFYSFIVNVFYLHGQGLGMVLALFILTATTMQIITRPLEGAMYSISITLFGVLYTVFTISHAMLYFAWEDGIFFIVTATLATTMTDVGAFSFGKLFGKHNAGLALSPKKTYEGFAGGFLFALFIMHIFRYIWVYFYPETLAHLPSIFHFSLFVVFISFVSIVGDLVESGIKRDAHIKDSADMIPGHGGVLDRVDSLLFTLPAGYYFLKLYLALA